MNTLIASIKKAYSHFIATRQTAINFKVADSIKHRYPPNTSLHTIVRDLKNKQQEQRGA